MSRFTLTSPTSSASASARASSRDSDSDSDDNLPYPVPLQRTDFLNPNFSPSDYLSTLRNRHQTLEDLRSELRSRSQLLSKELLDLVNANYADFLGLGRSLTSGDEKVEEVRVGLLGFRNEVETVRAKVAERDDQVGEALEERRDVRRSIMLGRRLVEWEGRLKGLEEGLVVDSAGKTSADDDSSEEEDDDEDEGNQAFGVSIGKLRRHVQQWRIIQDVEKSVEKVMGETHPFIAAQMPRMMKIRNTLLLDLSTALKQARSAGTEGVGRVMNIMIVYADMEESAEAVKVLKALNA